MPCMIWFINKSRYLLFLWNLDIHRHILGRLSSCSHVYFFLSHLSMSFHPFIFLFLWHFSSTYSTDEQYSDMRHIYSSSWPYFFYWLSLACAILRSLLGPCSHFSVGFLVLLACHILHWSMQSSCHGKRSANCWNFQHSGCLFHM